MKKLAFLFMFLAYVASAQSFTAETEDIYTGENPKEFFGLVKILSGTLKKTDKMIIYAETGRRFTATITAMKDLNRQQVNQVQAGESVMLDFTTMEDASSGSDYLRKGYKIFPAGFKSATVAASVAKKGDLSGKLDGKLFEGKLAYKGAVYYKKGVRKIFEKPYLQLQFAAVKSPDTRVLTLQLFYPKESPARYTAADMEVNFSGAADGKKENTTLHGFVNGKGDTDFSLDVTQWRKEGNRLLLSGKISGKLKPVLFSGKILANTFENAVFEDIEVEVINEMIDTKLDKILK